MKALYFDKKLTLAELPKPIPEKGEALIKVLSAGICQTDLEIIKGYMNFKGILGHEFVGKAEECSSPSLQGKKVVGEINIGCGQCSWCLKNLSRHCPNRNVLGIYGKDGVFAEYVTLPERNLHILPDSFSNEEGIFVEPLAAALEIEEQVHLMPNNSVAVIGDGRLGQLAAQLMHLRGFPLLVIGKYKEKLNLLNKLGINTRLSSQRIDKKFDVVIECSGSIQGFESAIKLVRPRGTIVQKSTIAQHHKLNLADVVINEIHLIGSRCGPFEPAIRLLAQKIIKVQPLISACFPLEQGLAAFEQARNKKSIKVILVMDE